MQANLKAHEQKLNELALIDLEIITRQAHQAQLE
jgi:hypothetical protein